MRETGGVKYSKEIWIPRKIAKSILLRCRREAIGTAIALNMKKWSECVWASRETFQISEISMLSWALTFLVIALIAGVLGFGVIAGTAATIAKVCFFIFIVLFIVGLVMGRRGTVV